MSGFAEPTAPALKCSHCGRFATWMSARGLECGSSVCSKLNRLRDALQDLVTVCEADPTFNDPTNEPDSYAALFAARGALESYGS